MATKSKLKRFGFYLHDTLEWVGKKVQEKGVEVETDDLESIIFHPDHVITKLEKVKNGRHPKFQGTLLFRLPRREWDDLDRSDVERAFHWAVADLLDEFTGLGTILQVGRVRHHGEDGTFSVTVVPRKSWATTWLQSKIRLVQSGGKQRKNPESKGTSASTIARNLKF